MIMNYLGTTFIPGEDPEGSERRIVADQPVIIYKPKGSVSGLTFVLTAANIPLSKYQSIIDALSSINHAVVGFFINVASPIANNHRMKAERIPIIFSALKAEFQVKNYNIVGHSVGGKIALLTAALHDDGNLIRNVISLDPVDQTPVEFTHAKDSGIENLSLEKSQADITITFTDSGYFILKSHTGREIQKNNPSTKLILHRNTCHMVYCDDGGLLSWKALTGWGSSADRNKVVKEQTLQLIKDTLTKSSIAGNASGAMSSVVGKAKKSVTGKISEAKDMANETQKKGKSYVGMAKAFNVMG
ncbi:hypothetical protein ACHAXS_003187 [Conticribra weissflogii]